MILYFSATGNTEFVAKEIASRLGDDCVNLLDRIKQGDLSPIHSDKPFVICAPVYVCEMPRFMAKYLKKLTLTGSKEAYFIFTSGGYCGISGPLAKKIIKRKKMKYRGHAEIKMPRNYVANDSYPMLPKNEVEERLTLAYQHIKQVAEDIKAGNKLKARYVFLFEKLITLPFNPYWCKHKLKADEFYAKDNCLGCGKCAKLCPLNNIKIVDKKPVWGDNCTHCMACIANCPIKSIEFGNVTQNKEAYTYNKYSYVINDIKKSENKEN